jgi:hypothetical protein
MKEYEKLSPEERTILHNNFLKDPDAFYKKAEEDQMKKNLQQNYKERFLTMTRLMKLNLLLAKAKISLTKFPSNTGD